MTAKKSFVLICFTFFSGICSYSQSDKDLVAVAQETYKYGDKTDALEQFKKAADLNPQNVKALFMTGKVALETINKRIAFKYLHQVYALDSTYDEELLYFLGKASHINERFDLATDYYLKYKNLITKNGKRRSDPYLVNELDNKIAQCAYAKQMMQKPISVEIISLGSAINSVYPDYAPVVSSDEKMLIFTSRRKGGTSNDKDFNNEYFEDIYVSFNVDGVWSKAENLGPPVNTKKHEGALHLSADGQELVIYKPLKMGDFFATKHLGNNKWSTPEPVFKKLNSDVSETSIAIPASGEFVIFSSNRGGGIGDFDLYMSRKGPGGEWSMPKNLGPIINTEFDEDAPHISADGRTLYFSSRGHLGLGGYDVFKSTYDPVTDTWTEPENLGYPVNTVDDDVYYIPVGDGSKAYYTSVRDNGTGDKDIFLVSYIKEDAPTTPTELIAQNTTTPETSKPESSTDTEIKENEITTPSTLKAGQTEKRNNTNDEINIPSTLEASSTDKWSASKDEVNQKTTLNNTAKENSSQEGATSETKKFRVKVLGIEAEGINAPVVKLQNTSTGTVLNLVSTGDGYHEVEVKGKQNTPYRLSVEQEGYVFASKNVDLSQSSGKDIIEETFRLNPVEKGLVTVMRNIYFDFSKTELKDESYPELVKLERMLQDNSKIIIQINGHTDNIGSKKFNLSLSKKRAVTVATHLINKGIDPSRVVSKGFGYEKPLVSNDDEEEGRALNRRIEFQIIENK